MRAIASAVLTIPVGRHLLQARQSSKGDTEGRVTEKDAWFPFSLFVCLFALAARNSQNVRTSFCEGCVSLP